MADERNPLVDRIIGLGLYDGDPSPVEVARDCLRVMATLFDGFGDPYCWCQSFPCECVGQFGEDVAEVITFRHQLPAPDDDEADS